MVEWQLPKLHTGGSIPLTRSFTYNNQIANPYTPNTGAGPLNLSIGVIAWSFGKDGVEGTTNFSASDDVISWQ